MKSVIASILILLTVPALASEENIELYHPAPPNASLSQRPAIPKLTSPAPLATVSAGDISFSWSKVDDASSYALQISADPNFFNLIVNETIYHETSFTLKGSNLEGGKNYYWRVASLKEDNQPGTMKSLFNRSSFTVK